MDHKEIALQLTLKAIECKLIQAKSLAYNTAEDPTNDCAMSAAKDVNDFYQETLRRLNGC